MRRAVTVPYVTLLLLVLLASLLFAGCGSASEGDYLREVSALNRETAEKLEGSLHLLAEGTHSEGEAGTESLISSLEESVLVMEEALAELEGIKVPAGWENYHNELASFYHSNLAAYQVYLAALAPVEEQTESHVQGEEESTEEGGEEAPQEEEMPREEEAPVKGSGH